MMQATGEQVKTVAEVILGDTLVRFQADGSAVMVAGLTIECGRCNALHDLEGDPISFAPPEAWGLLQAARRFLDTKAYRLVSETIIQAIEGK